MTFQTFKLRAYSTIQGGPSTKKGSRPIRKTLGFLTLVFGGYTSAVVYSLKADEGDQFYNNYLHNIPRASQYRAFLSDFLNNPTSTIVSKYDKVLQRLEKQNEVRPVVQIDKRLVKTTGLDLTTNNIYLKQLITSYIQLAELINKNGGADPHQESKLSDMLSIINKMQKEEENIKVQQKENKNKEKNEANTIKNLENKLKELESKNNEQINTLHSQLKTKEEDLKSQRESRQKMYEEKLESELLKEKGKMEREYKRNVKALVEKEKSSRISRLDEIDTLYTQYETKFFENVALSNKLKQSIKETIILNEIENELRYTTDPQLIKKAKKILSNFDTSNDTINSCIENIHKYFEKEKRYSKRELQKRFNLNIYDELKGCSMAQESNGFIGHIISKVMAAVLFEKKETSYLNLKGNRDSPKSTIEIVQLARHEINKGNIEFATRILNQLNGWPKYLAKDFINDCINELEFDMNIKTIKLEHQYNIFKALNSNTKNENK